MTRMQQLSEGREGVLACFDGSEGAARALRWAAGEAAALQRPLVAMQSFEWDMPSLHGVAADGTYNEREVRRQAEAELENAVAGCRETFAGLSVLTATPEGPPESTVIELADGLDPRLVVAGASGRGALARMLLGSTAAELARGLRQPFVVVRGEPAPPEAPVVVGVDGSGTSEHAVEFALDFAWRHQAPVRAVHSWTDWPLDTYATAPPGQVGLYHVDQASQEVAKEQVDAVSARYPGVAVEWESVTERPTHALLDRGDGARLLVAGSHGRGPVTRALLGSVSHAVLYHAPCPVAVVRGAARRGFGEAPEAPPVGPAG